MSKFAAWTIDEAISIIRMNDSNVKHYNYHLALGGSVLVNGWSDKDLDLYALPMHNDEICQPDRLLKFIQGVLRVVATESKFYKDSNNRADVLYMLTLPDKRRIDFFIINRPNQ